MSSEYNPMDNIRNMLQKYEEKERAAAMDKARGLIEESKSKDWVKNVCEGACDSCGAQDSGYDRSEQDGWPPKGTVEGVDEQDYDEEEFSSEEGTLTISADGPGASLMLEELENFIRQRLVIKGDLSVYLVRESSARGPL